MSTPSQILIVELKKFKENGIFNHKAAAKYAAELLMKSTNTDALAIKSDTPNKKEMEKFNTAFRQELEKHPNLASRVTIESRDNSGSEVGIGATTIKYAVKKPELKSTPIVNKKPSKVATGVYAQGDTLTIDLKELGSFSRTRTNWMGNVVPNKATDNKLIDILDYLRKNKDIKNIKIESNDSFFDKGQIFQKDTTDFNTGRIRTFVENLNQIANELAQKNPLFKDIQNKIPSSTTLYSDPANNAFKNTTIPSPYQVATTYKSLSPDTQKPVSTPESDKSRKNPTLFSDYLKPQPAKLKPLGTKKPEEPGPGPGTEKPKRP